MSDLVRTETAKTHLAHLATLLAAIPPGRRGPMLQIVASFAPGPSWDASFEVGPLRAVFADVWEAKFAAPPPLRILRECLSSPVPIRTSLEFGKLCLTHSASDIQPVLESLLDFLAGRLCGLEATAGDRTALKPGAGATTSSAHPLAEQVSRIPRGRAETSPTTSGSAEQTYQSPNAETGTKSWNLRTS